MKAAAFDYAKPADVEAAVALLVQADGGAKAVAGTQSLGPMLNLRLVQPDLLVDLRGIEELREASQTADAVTYGACVTHAAIEDGRVPDAGRGLMAFVAANIAYRAVRNRGTIGGSLAHADPTADWPSAMALLGATLLIAGPGGRREVPMARFVAGPFETAVGQDEVLVAVRVPKLSAAARWGYRKFCRRTGEFAEAIGGALADPARGVCRAVVGATHGAPLVLDGAWPDPEAAVAQAGMADDVYERRIHATMLRRALTDAGAP
jgi:carbon-monoxide dehydrogenase medium subunit